MERRLASNPRLTEAQLVFLLMAVVVKGKPQGAASLILRSFFALFLRFLQLKDFLAVNSCYGV